MRTKKNLKIRNYKIAVLYQNDKCVPFIKLTGKWLEENNFKVGDRIKVSLGKDILLITKEN